MATIVIADALQILDGFTSRKETEKFNKAFEVLYPKIESLMKENKELGEVEITEEELELFK